eukprot:6108591-Pyramimonas_sp.AAC.1
MEMTAYYAGTRATRRSFRAACGAVLHVIPHAIPWKSKHRVYMVVQLKLLGSLERCTGHFRHNALLGVAFGRSVTLLVCLQARSQSKQRGSRLTGVPNGADSLPHGDQGRP